MSDDKKWYYAHDTNTIGPFDKETMTRMLQAGLLNRDTQVIQQGDETWSRLAESSLRDSLDWSPPPLAARVSFPRNRIQAIIIIRDGFLIWSILAVVQLLVYRVPLEDYEALAILLPCLFFTAYLMRGYGILSVTYLSLFVCLNAILSPWSMNKVVLFVWIWLASLLAFGFRKIAKFLPESFMSRLVGFGNRLTNILSRLDGLVEKVAVRLRVPVVAAYLCSGLILIGATVAVPKISVAIDRSQRNKLSQAEDDRVMKQDPIWQSLGGLQRPSGNLPRLPSSNPGNNCPLSQPNTNVQETYATPLMPLNDKYEAQ